MKIYKETDLESFDAWGGAEDTQDRIMNEGKECDFDAIICELYPDGLSDTQLNDLLRFDSEWFYESLGIEEDDEDDEEEEE